MITLIHSKILFQEPVSILELGSGLGLFGMTMLKMGHSFTFTDCHHAVLNFLVTNSKLNFNEVSCILARAEYILNCSDDHL